MKFITEEENKKVLEYIREVGWGNYRNNQRVDNNNEPIVVRIKGSIYEYAKRNGYVNASDAMKIIEKRL